MAVKNSRNCSRRASAEKGRLLEGSIVRLRDRASSSALAAAVAPEEIMSILRDCASTQRRGAFVALFGLFWLCR